MALLSRLKRLVRVSPVTDLEIQSSLASSFNDFEDAIQYCSAKGETGIRAVVTRNKADYSASEIPVLSPEEYLAMRESGSG